MAARRDFEVIGETLVKVRCGAHLSGVWNSGQSTGTANQTLHLLNELGLAQGPIKVSLIGHHEDMRIDGFGPKAPADILYNYGEARIDMTLVHYNPSLLELCYNESMGGNVTNQGLTPPGTPLGKGNVIYASGCNYVGLLLWPATQGRFLEDLRRGVKETDARARVGSGAWNFWATHITMTPQEIPLSTKVTAIDVSWRGIAYAHFAQRLQRDYPVPSPRATASDTAGLIRLYSRTIPDEVIDRTTEVSVP